ncbi:hypothetical protein BZG35_04620 [Brevundimonas sp. LM2]|nr:hypothetical protein BZG35_04620 [Brevundimonas sp. LM2]
MRSGGRPGGGAVEASLDRSRAAGSARDFIARDKLGAADALVGRIFEAAEDLVNFPLRGLEHSGTRVRLLPIKGTSMMLIYEIVDDATLIYEVRHMARRPFGGATDYSALLRSGGLHCSSTLFAA